MMRTLLLTSMAALALAACGDTKTDPAKEQAAIAKVAAPAGKSWSQTVVKTPEGGYLMGNPDAPIKLVEYGSLTCSHCADFSNESHEELSRDFVDTLLARLHKQGTGLYAALNYDGRTEWTPAHPLDDAVLQAFNKDQRTAKGLGEGAALGPDATGYLQTRCTALDYAVHIEDSPWQLGPDDAALVRELISGIARAVAVGYELDAEALLHWKTFRLANAATGTCVVGHQDLLAVPV